MSDISELSKITVKKPGTGEVEGLGILSWPVWTKEPSTFDWYYEANETCFLLEGEVTVKTAEGEISFGKGDLVTFPKGLKCTWHVKQGVRKHYQFGE